MVSQSSPQQTAPGIGIDIEQCDHLPAVAPSSDAFYQENFTRAEIAYCQRQPNPRESFCGLWCAKEAAKKCSAEFLNLKPIEVEIGHDEQGRPFLTRQREGQPPARRPYHLSISHAHGLAIAVCVAQEVSPVQGNVSSNNDSSRSIGLLSWIALALGCLNLLLWLLLAKK